MQCDFTVGYGGSPDTSGETTLDAMIMDGKDQAMGAVAYLRSVKNAIRVARSVMEHSSHSILAGEGALEFAKMMGFQQESLSTPYSTKLYHEWQSNHCQPNYFRNVVDQSTSCPPYKPISRDQQSSDSQVSQLWIDHGNHDTIGMVALNSLGQLAGGTSSNGANHKIKGRVGDAPIPGAGAYVDNTKGGAAATGDGDIMMRFLPSYRAVQDMGQGICPQKACENALKEIAKKYPSFKGGMVCLNTKGEYGGAGYGWNFSYSVMTMGMQKALVVKVPPLQMSVN
ncbi:N(4)-(Beta-N-acetylglucosaminyl)-L-asparaginase [Thraustotheca clavata]|uniref:N(4)-(Beta-N-acetylglucosaminyl)-L-asparaginase n=1 Tax=Thraustotheca clavata TaxID=74557 RepID=A0A1W0ABN7_9STRA|nr:N(4)-(Beta-N-acetylglucosaminyl)-L-asparaginase [Thraustotheca clavata]